MAKNIFTQKEIHCPVCKAGFQLKYPNPKLYAAAEREDDQRVISYTWLEGYQTDQPPHYYSVLQCPHCYYADFFEKLERPGHDAKGREIYKQMAQLPTARQYLLQQLHRMVPAESVDGIGAVGLHLAAIFQTLLPAEQPLIDHMKLGRLYLRLAWLYKELKNDAADAPVQDQSMSTSRKLYKAVEKVDEKIQDILEYLESASELAEQRAEELNLSNGDNPFMKVIRSVENQIERSHQELSELEHIVQQDMRGILTVKTGANGPEAKAELTGESLDLDQHIENLVPLWPQIPRDEISARNLAINALEYSLKNEETGQDVTQAAAVGNLLLELLYGTGQWDKALEYSLSLYTNSFRDKQALQMNLNQLQKDGAGNEVKELNRMLTVVSNTLAKSAEARKVLLEKIFDRDKEKIRTLLKNKAGSTPQELETELEAKGFHKELIRWLKDREAIIMDLKKKKWSTGRLLG